MFVHYALHNTQSFCLKNNFITTNTTSIITVKFQFTVLLCMINLMLFGLSETLLAIFHED